MACVFGELWAVHHWEQLDAESWEVIGFFSYTPKSSQLKQLKYLPSKAPWKYNVEKETAETRLCGPFCIWGLKGNFMFLIGI